MSTFIVIRNDKEAQKNGWFFSPFFSGIRKIYSIRNLIIAVDHIVMLRIVVGLWMNELINWSMRDHIQRARGKKTRYRSFSFIAFRIWFLCFDNNLLKSINRTKQYECNFFNCLAVAFQFCAFNENVLRKCHFDRKMSCNLILFSMCGTNRFGRPTIKMQPKWMTRHMCA